MNRPDPGMIVAVMAALGAGLVALSYLALRGRFRPQPSDHEKSRPSSAQPLPGWFWLMIALAAGGLSTLDAARRNRLPRGAEWLGWGGLGAIILMFGWLAIGPIQLALRPGRDGSRDPQRRPAKIPRVSPFGLVISLGIVMAYLSLVMAVHGMRQNDLLGLASSVILGCTGVVAVLGFCWILLRQKFSPERRILAQAQSGDVPGAIAAVQELMETRGRTVDRLNTLGLCYQMSERFEEARSVFLEALLLAGSRNDLRNNIAVALLNLGSLEEAEFILSQLCEQEPTQFVYLANYCHVLVKLGRLDEAAQIFHQAEDARAATVPIGKSASQIYDRMLDDCRQLLAAKADRQEGPGREI